VNAKVFLRQAFQQISLRLAHQILRPDVETTNFCFPIRHPVQSKVLVLVVVLIEGV